MLTYFSNRKYGSNFIKQHSETVTVWNYQNANCSLRKKLYCVIYTIIFGTLSFPIDGLITSLSASFLSGFVFAQLCWCLPDVRTTIPTTISHSRDGYLGKSPNPDPYNSILDPQHISTVAQTFVVQKSVHCTKLKFVGLTWKFTTR